MLKLFTFAQAFAAQKFYAVRDREGGQTMAEYAVVLAVVTLLVLVSIQTLSGAISTAITKVAGIIK
jgi:Flp pilus assembly pilin Flp